MKKILSLTTALIIAGTISTSAFAKENCNVKRIYGEDRYKTSFNISSNFTSGKVKNIIVASGKDFPDALTGSVLSKKLDAPIILTGSSNEESKNCIEYIKNNLDKDGKVYILGGNASVSTSVVEEIKSLGCTDIIRLGGQDRFDTNKIIAGYMNAAKGTPIVIANAYGFADALSVSSIASIKGYPILMTSKEGLSSNIKKVIEDVQPSEVYVIGGQGSVSDNVIGEVKKIVPNLNDSKIIRLGGLDRYETSMKVCSHFDLDTDTLVLANGENFPDALSGSALASKMNAPVVLTNGLDIKNQKAYIDKKAYSNLYILGGPGVIDLTTEYALKANSISEDEKKDVDNLLLACKSFLDLSREESKEVANLQSSIDNSFEAIKNAKNPEEIKSSFANFIQVYSNVKTYVEDYRKSLVDIKSNVESIKGEGSLYILKNQYLDNINIELNRVDKTISFMDSYIGWGNSMIDLINSNDENKINEHIKKLETILETASQIAEMQNGQVGIGDVGLKLVNIKNIINGN